MRISFLASKPRRSQRSLALFAGCILLLCGRSSPAAILPGFHPAPPVGPYLIHLDPLPLEPLGPDFIPALPMPPGIPSLVFAGVDTGFFPLEPWHWEVEFSNPNPFPVGPFFAALVTPGLPPGTAATVSGPITLGVGATTLVLTGAPFYHFPDPGAEVGPFSVTVTNGLGFPIDLDFVMAEWDPVLAGAPSGSTVGTPVPLPPLAATVLFSIVPEPASIILFGLGWIGLLSVCVRRRRR